MLQWKEDKLIVSDFSMIPQMKDLTTDKLCLERIFIKIVAGNLTKKSEIIWNQIP